MFKKSNVLYKSIPTKMIIKLESKIYNNESNEQITYDEWVEDNCDFTEEFKPLINKQNNNSKKPSYFRPVTPGQRLTPNLPKSRTPTPNPK